MSPFVVQAPGKVVLVGEYAVLDGAPAVVAAVDRGVGCEVAAADRVVIETPGDDRFVRAALEAAPPARYRFSDWNPVDLPSKPGLGGSAAATVAAVLAAAEASGRPLTPTDLARAAAEVHHRVQGSGSGIDIAASAHGGVIRFHRTEVSALPRVEPVVVWSGTSARTGPRVERYLAWPGRTRFVDESAAVVDGFSDDPVAAIRAAARLLEVMSREAGIDWWTGALKQITLLAARYGGAAKPSGAGGGDVAIALFDDPDRAATFAQRCNACGLPVITTHIAPGAAVRRGPG